MLTLRDFFHLPQVDRLLGQIIEDRSGLTIVAGLDARPHALPVIRNQALPGGRTTLFRLVLDEILNAHPRAVCAVVAEQKDLLRVSGRSKRRFPQFEVQNLADYPDAIAEAARRKPDVIVVERLCAESVPVVLDAAGQGQHILAQLDTPFCGGEAARYLLDLGASLQSLSGIHWILSVQRMPRLCSHCKQPVLPAPEYLTRLQPHYAELIAIFGKDGKFPGSHLDQVNNILSGEVGAFFRASGCERCGVTGRNGDVAVFDIFRSQSDANLISPQTSLLPIKTYILYMASLGEIALDDLEHFEEDQNHRNVNLLQASELALQQANLELERKLVQFEAAHRVLEQRTEALISLQKIGQALITETEIDNLASMIARTARNLCGADRVVLYLLRANDQVEIVSALGWDPGSIQERFTAHLISDLQTGTKPVPFNRPPPGVRPRYSDTELLQAGLLVPLTAQDKQVGWMAVHTTYKPRFEPGEVSLLQSFAHQAALAMQRTELIEQLREKINQLEAAQVELAQKERLDHEMELARQVQQSVLPQAFPSIPGYIFAARNSPAREVGGDFYDVIQLDGEHFGVAVGDVSDKGMPAALYMALTRSLLRAEAHRELSPRAVLENVNRLLLELGEPDLFVTVFYGVIDLTNRRFTYARAGHDRPFLLRNNSIEELRGQGMALGLFDDRGSLPGYMLASALSEEVIALRPGDRLVLYSDGLCDFPPVDGDVFDRNQLRILFKASAQLPPGEFCRTIFDQILQVQGDAQQYDDMTMLVVQVEGYMPSSGGL